MVIQNGCVTLRAIEEYDFQILYDMMQSPKIERSMGHCTAPISEKQQREWMANYKNSDEQIRLMIELENGKTIGTIMLFDIDMQNGVAEVGYKLMADKADRMTGDMADAMNGMLNYAFNTLRLNCVVARTLTENEKSERVLTNAGFSYEGTLRARVFQDGEYLDMKTFSILKSEFTL